MNTYIHTYIYIYIHSNKIIINTRQTLTKQLTLNLIASTNHTTTTLTFNYGPIICLATPVTTPITTSLNTPHNHAHNHTHNHTHNHAPNHAHNQAPNHDSNYTP